MAEGRAREAKGSRARRASRRREAGREGRVEEKLRGPHGRGKGQEGLATEGREGLRKGQEGLTAEGCRQASWWGDVRSHGRED